MLLFFGKSSYFSVHGKVCVLDAAPLDRDLMHLAERKLRAQCSKSALESYSSKLLENLRFCLDSQGLGILSLSTVSIKEIR